MTATNGSLPRFSGNPDAYHEDPDGGQERKNHENELKGTSGSSEGWDDTRGYHDGNT